MTIKLDLSSIAAAAKNLYEADKEAYADLFYDYLLGPDGDLRTEVTQDEADHIAAVLGPYTQDYRKRR